MAQPSSYVVALLIAATRHGPAYFQLPDGLYLTEFKQAPGARRNAPSRFMPDSHRLIPIAEHPMARLGEPLNRFALPPKYITEHLIGTQVALRSSSPMAIPRARGSSRFLATRPQQAQFLDSQRPSDGECRPRWRSSALRSAAAAAGLLRQIMRARARVVSLFSPLRLHSTTLTSGTPRRGNFVRRVGTGRADLSAGAFRPLEPWTTGG